MSYPLSYNLIIFVTGSIFIYQRLLSLSFVLMFSFMLNADSQRIVRFSFIGSGAHRPHHCHSLLNNLIIKSMKALF